MEIYRPPYLFKGARPVIISTPSAAASGSDITISTNVAVAKAVLVSPGAVTHATDMHQRLIEVATTPTPTGNGLVAAIPNNGTLPPGPYMLFALDSNGVPSVASWVQVD